MKTLLGDPTVPTVPTIFETANERSVAALRMLVETGRSARLAMVGDSMLPLLRKPMVLELGPFTQNAKAGEVLVFAQGAHLVAHRVIGFHDDIILTAGDNTPWKSEEVRTFQVVGSVVAVYADDGPDAKRVDDWLFQSQGFLKARLHGLRRLAHQLRHQLARGSRGLNAWGRVRRFPILVKALTAIFEDNKEGLESALAAVGHLILLPTVRNHGCSSILLQGISRLGIDPDSNIGLITGLQKSSRATALKVLLLRDQIASLVSILDGASIDFALLKGAARIYRGDADAHFHKSSDIDVLIRKIDMDAAINALSSAGYVRRATDEMAALYVAHHHHYAPLRPPNGGAAVELHVALSQPGTLSRTLDWDYLSRYLLTFEGPNGRAQFLNNAGAAIHLATHAIGIRRLRDVVVLAQLMTKLDQSELSQLQRFVNDESAELIRLDATFMLAAQIAGIPWEGSTRAKRYVAWVNRREDLPIFIRQRSTVVESCYGTYNLRLRIASLMADLLPIHDNRAWKRKARSQMRSAWVSAVSAPLRLGGRMVMNVISYLYAEAMPAENRPIR